MVLIAYSAMTLTEGGPNASICQSDFTSGTLWYQSETEEATGRTEISIPHRPNAESTILDAFVLVTPIMMVWESSDLVSSAHSATGLSSLQSPSAAFTPRPTGATTGTSIPHSESSISAGAVAAISASLAVLLLVAAFLFYRAWRRRRSNKNPQPERNSGNNLIVCKPNGELKAEMEDPMSARELFKQSGAFRGKPELGNEVDRTNSSNPGEVDRTIPPSTQDNVAEDSSPGDRASMGLGHADPAELE